MQTKDNLLKFNCIPACDFIPNAEAVQTNFPASSFAAPVIFRVPSARTWDLPRGKTPPTFDHVTIGLNSAVALQETDTSSPLVICKILGGFTVNCGRSTTVKSVEAETEPSRLDALHSYRPESGLLVL